MIEASTAGNSWLSWQCLDNIAGCILADIAMPAYTDYQQRKLDFLARVEALGTLLWLRQEHSFEPVSDRLLAQRPEALQQTGYAIGVAEGGEALQVEQRSPRDESPFAVPLSTSRR